MNLEQLLEKLDLESPEQFEYFENFADLVESDEEIYEEELFQLFSDTDHQTVSELIYNYFEDITDAVPDGEAEVFTLLESIKMSLMGLIRNADDDSSNMQFAEELARFIRWYSGESVVECTNQDDSSDVRNLNLRDTFTLERLARLEKENFLYDFSEVLEYQLDDYSMKFADMIAEEQEMQADYSAEAEDLNGMSREELLENGYVLDDEEY